MSAPGPSTTAAGHGRIARRRAPVARAAVLLTALATHFAPATVGCDRAPAAGGGSEATAGPPPRAPRPGASTLPGAGPHPPELREALARAVASRGEGWAPRTRHLAPDGSPRFTNRLALESSPYLLQHAHNPVSWYPWGDEAFAIARATGRPVLLSIGYSTCHWCHVMEEESFEDLEIATYLNEHYVAIKVDREERPDVDAVYMAAVQGLTGRGGWPMTTWLTADRAPFHGGTYFPPRDGDRGVRVGFLTLLRRLHEVHEREPGQVAADAAQVAGFVRAGLAPPTGAPDGPRAWIPGPALVDRSVELLARDYDDEWGGLRGRRAKFPSSLPVRLLLRVSRRTGAERPRAMALHTLRAMAAGGLHDHVGGGFHRYSTDRRWLVPHFEKMLYDQALLTLAYLEGYEASGGEGTGEDANAADLARVARRTLDSVARDLTAPGGGFTTSTDADSPGPGGEREEGRSFTWTPAELRDALGNEGAREAMAFWAVEDGGNFEGRSILHTPRPLPEVAAELALAPAELRRRLDASRATLLAARARRPPPLRDDKVLTGWNGLMIAAAARGGRVLDEPRHVELARRAADFVLAGLRPDGRLRRSHAGGRARLTAYLEDHAFLILGLLELYEATGEPRWLAEASRVEAQMAAHHEDREGWGYWRTAHDAETLLVREKPTHDGALPSGNAAAALAGLRLEAFTLDPAQRERAERTLAVLGPLAARDALAHSTTLLALERRAAAAREVLVVCPRSRDEAAPFLAVLRRTYLPHASLVVAVEGEDLAAHAALVPWARERGARGGRATAYVCRGQVCDLPTTDPAVFERLLAAQPDEGPPA